MKSPKTFLAAAALALALPGSAFAAAPWTAPVTVGTGGTPAVIGDTVAFNAPGSFPGVPLLRSVDGRPATQWNTSGADFDAAFGAFAGDLYVGSNGSRHVIVGRQTGSTWSVRAYGPRTAGARVAAAPGAAVFATFSPGRVYLVREGHSAQRLSGRGSIRSVAVATHGKDVLVAWDRHGKLEYRQWRAGKLTPVKQLASVTAAMHLSVALDAHDHALIAWVDQPINEGSTGVRAQVEYSRDFGKPKQLERYPDLTVVSGVGVKAAFVAGKPVVAWSGRTAVRALVAGRTVDLAPIPADGNTNDGLTDLAVSGSRAVAVMGSGTQVFAAPLVDGAFAPTETVSAPGQFLGRASASFDGTRAFVAWTDPALGVEVAQRPF